ncbi:unknown protein [Seminavis robusta]|uniref:phytol kinase n=1 Tax=Seminavis robusta TaxID=568900 RepID=A0A9N8HCR8_9STRA|nr:unknown protein [Seminavis robusta]|eukprot:Sro230_g093250.1 n/a (459) ;mRNA; f:19094-20470
MEIDKASTGSDSDMSIEPFSEAQNEPSQQPGSLLARLKAAKLKSHSPETTSTAHVIARNCKACNMDAEFIPEGMTPCSRCNKVFYCSSDCMEWDWKHGDHGRNCDNAKTGPIPMDIVHDDQVDDMSIDAFEEDETRASNVESATQQAAVNTATGLDDTVRCKACGMNEAYVSDGMKTCIHCHLVAYCSNDCLDWDWSRGGHVHQCRGLSHAERAEAEQQLSKAAASLDGDDNLSIAAFEDNNDNTSTPGETTNEQNLSGDLSQSKISNTEEIRKCNACGLDRDYVPGGMKPCNKCHEVIYCSLDCMEWDWDDGGHEHNCNPKTEREIAELQKKAFIDKNNMPNEAFQEEDAGLEKRSGAEPHKSTPLNCHSCNINSEFVPDRMITCQKCKNVHYCSPDCQQWHWKQGGHAKACEGNNAARESIVDEKQARQDSDQESIDDFKLNARHATWMLPMFLLG